MSNLREQVKGLKIGKRKRRDIDPEDDTFGKDHDSETSEESSREDNNGREHYEPVGKSSLRKPEDIPLGAKYGGVVVSRAVLSEDNDRSAALASMEGSEDDDPFAKTSAYERDSDENPDDLLEVSASAQFEDEEIDSDEAFGESDVERFKNFKFRGSKSGGTKQLHSENKSEGQGDTTSEDEDLVSAESADSGSQQESSDSVESYETDDSQSNVYSEVDEDENNAEQSSARYEKPLARPSTKREELRALLSGETATVASSLSQAASLDAKKGKAVKQQNQTFDRLLDARIKLQKGLVVINDEENMLSKSTTNEAGLALRNAEEAALRLYSTIESLRHTMLESSSSTSDPNSKKRKRPESRIANSSTASMWSSLVDTESRSLWERRTVLDKWSNKVRASDPSQVASSAKQRFLSQEDTAQQSKLSTVLDTYLLGERDRLSFAATNNQVEAQDVTDFGGHRPPIPGYNDGAFYQSLLRDLINSRAASSNSSSNLAIPVVPLKLHPSGNKSRQKTVDTRASKGRKVRYTVHEKLQNFMAAEGDSGRDTSQWTEAAKREFFGSLMGQSRALDENEVAEMQFSEMDVEGLDEDQREVEALRLFRS